jgi:hypothetical protein
MYSILPAWRHAFSTNPYLFRYQLYLTNQDTRSVPFKLDTMCKVGFAYLFEPTYIVQASRNRDEAQEALQNIGFVPNYSNDIDDLSKVEFDNIGVQVVSMFTTLIFLETIAKTADQLYQNVIDNKKAESIMHASNPIYNKMNSVGLAPQINTPCDALDRYAIVELTLPYDHYYHIICCIKVRTPPIALLLPSHASTCHAFSSRSGTHSCRSRQTSSASAETCTDWSTPCLVSQAERTRSRAMDRAACPARALIRPGGTLSDPAHARRRINAQRDQPAPHVDRDQRHVRRQRLPVPHSRRRPRRRRRRRPFRRHQPRVGGRPTALPPGLGLCTREPGFRSGPAGGCRQTPPWAHHAPPRRVGAGFKGQALPRRVARPTTTPAAAALGARCTARLPAQRS